MASRGQYQQVFGTNAGPTIAAKIDLAKFHHGVGILVTIPGGTTALYNVEVTGDDPANGFSNWNLHDILQAQTTSMNSNLLFPVTGVRLNLQSITGPGPVVMSVVQAGG